MAITISTETNAINQVTNLLNSHQARYLILSHSSAYTPDDIAVDEFSLGRALIEAVVIRIAQNRYAMIVVRATRKIELNSLRVALNNPSIEFVGKNQKELFPGYEVGALPPFGHLFDMAVFFTDELYHLQEVCFCVQSHTQRIRMSFQDYLRIAQPQQHIEVETSARYHATITSVNPQSARGRLQEYDTCFLGFSLQNKNFTAAKLAGMTEWVSKNFSNCQVLIGDSIHRLTLEIKGVPPQYAFNRALSLGRKIIDEETPVFERHADRCCFDLMLCSDIFDREECQAYYQQLQELFAADEAFSKSIRSFADIFVGKRLQQEPQHFDYYLNMSSTYLLEELAIFAYVAKQGVPIFVYPGELGIFREITQGFHLGVPEPLRNLISISLRLNSR